MTLSGLAGAPPTAYGSVAIPKPSLAAQVRNYKMYFWRAPDRLDLTGGTIIGLNLPVIEDEEGVPITDQVGSPLN